MQINKEGTMGRCKNIMRLNTTPNLECFSVQKGRTDTWKWGWVKGECYWEDLLEDVSFEVRF